MARRRLSIRTAASAAVAALLLSACPSGGDGDGGRAGSPTTARPRRGGTVRVGVWAAPDPGAAHLGGAAVRALALPQLFAVEPDGSWRPMLVEPGSDETGEGSTSARFRIRDGAVWSNGMPVTADDLRRSADAAWVQAVEGPSPDGEITLRFTRAFAGWRRLWSGVDHVPAPAPDVWGGPFVVASTVPGLETVLRRNDQWKGGAPHLDELRLVLVPDVTTARQLLARGELDVVMPPAYLHRRAQFEATPGVEVATAKSSGWWVGLFLDAEALELERRRAVIGSFDRTAFVRALLDGEATVATDLVVDDDGEPTWPASAEPGDVGALRGATVDLVTMVEEPMTPLVHRSMQKRARPAGGRFENRAGEYDLVATWLTDRSYDVALVAAYDAPTTCWTCRWGHLDAGLAAAADGGDPAAATALERRLRDEAHVLPLWRPVPLVAWRSEAVKGVQPNGYGLSAAWNAWQWSVP